ncbi:hypothetical protein ACFV6G_05975 [Streptomyces lavendulae]|uniref:hypothetical protein n=1 Tax=Streptomyces lavendulae TaxID=1914 RepID=UPI0036759F43
MLLSRLPEDIRDVGDFHTAVDLVSGAFTRWCKVRLPCSVHPWHGCFEEGRLAQGIYSSGGCLFRRDGQAKSEIVGFVVLTVIIKVAP